MMSTSVEGDAILKALAEHNGKAAELRVETNPQHDLMARIKRLERLFVLATMGGKDAAAETNKILRELIKDAGT